VFLLEAMAKPLDVRNLASREGPVVMYGKEIVSRENVTVRLEMEKWRADVEVRVTLLSIRLIPRTLPFGQCLLTFSFIRRPFPS
jgi:hypothetical protein